MNKTNIDIEKWIVENLKELDENFPDSIDLEANFFDIGLTSAQSIIMVERMKQFFNKKINYEDLWRYPTIGNFIESLYEVDDDEKNINKEKEINLENNSNNQEFAIIGMGCRFPNSRNICEFWENLMNGRECISKRKFGDNELLGGYIDEVDMFDNKFFRISPREAENIDPQQRHLLEVSWEAFEDANINPEDYYGKEVGVFIGISGNDYANDLYATSNVGDIYGVTGNSHAIASNRLSYFYNFLGPSISIDTACSSSLVAAHYACMSLANNDCNMAIVGGVNLILNDNITNVFAESKMLSPDFKCKAFDDNANGYVRGEGIGVVLIKRKEDAIKDGNTIYATILGSAVNQDGRSNGLTAPNLTSQIEVIKKALDKAKVLPDDVQYVEAHGTGTNLGDPIELAGLGTSICFGKSDKLKIGSVKTNIGHLEAAAGIASLIKVSLCLYNKKYVPSINFSKLNEKVNENREKIEIQTKVEDWDNAKRRIAGISSFGFGGTNSHLILSEFNADSLSKNVEGYDIGYILPISAKSKESLKNNEKKAIEFLSNNKCEVEKITSTYAKHRAKFTEKSAYVFSSVDKLEYKLIKQTNNKNKKIAYIFSGQGPGKLNWSGELFKNRFFAEKISEIDSLFTEVSGWSICDVLNNIGNKDFEDTDVAQPVIFAVQVSIAYVLEKYGIKPAAIVGHSLGEVAASYISGKLSLKDSVFVVYKRSLIMQKLKNKGRMMSITLSQNEVESLLIELNLSDRVRVAVINSSDSCVVSGPEEDLKLIMTSLETKNIRHTMLGVLYPFHSVEAESIQNEMENELRKIKTKAHKIDVYSTVTAKLADARTFSALYWSQQVHKPVQFYKTINSMVEKGCDFLIEINTQAIILPYLNQEFSNLDRESVLNKNTSAHYSIANLIAKLYVSDINIDWNNYYIDNTEKIKTPSYEWDKKQFWFKSSTSNKSLNSIQIENKEIFETECAIAEESGENDYIRELLSEILKIDISEISDNDNLVEMGIDSLSAYSIKSKVKNKYGCDIPLTKMIENMTVGDLRSYISDNMSNSNIETTGEYKPMVSDMQSLLWTIYNSDRNNCAYNQNFVANIDGKLNIEILENVVKQLLLNNNELRTKFHEENGVLNKSFCDIDELEYFIYDKHSIYSDNEIESKIAKLVSIPFNLTQGSLFKVYLLRKINGYVLVVCAHHMVIDLASISVLLAQLVENYTRAYNGLNLNCFDDNSYGKFTYDYSNYLNSENGNIDKEFWNEKLSGLLPVVDLSINKRPSKITYDGDIYRTSICNDVNNRIKNMAKKLNVTPLHILMSAYFILLYKYTGEKDIIIGMSATLRNDFGCENVVGDFINLLPIRSNIISDNSFSDFTRNVKQEVLSALHHQKYSFKKMLEDTSAGSIQGFSPIVQVAFSQENLNIENNKNMSGFITGHNAEFSFCDIKLSAKESKVRYSPYDLLLMADTSGQDLNLAWQYNTNIMDINFITSMSIHFENILLAFLENEDIKLSNIKMISDSECQSIFNVCNKNYAKVDERLFINAFEEVVEKYGSNIALSMNGAIETYKSFNEKINKVARYLQYVGAQKGDCIAICLNRSIETMELLIAILKIGCIYVPIDPDYPINRINYILFETKTNIVFVEEGFNQKSIETNKCNVIEIKDLDNKIKEFSNENLNIEINPNDLAYIIFTSGTTGKPKGVMIEHIGICNMVSGLNEGWKVSSDSKVLQFASLSFDASIAEIFITFLSGAELVLKSKKEILPGGDLESVLEKEDITEIILTPSVLMLTNPEKITKLKTVISAGESCNSNIIKKWAEGRRFVNAYGPTESTVCSSYKVCSVIDSENITIGKAISGTKLYVLDSDLNPVPLGMPGELCISSIGLARGYFNNFDATEEKFIKNEIDKNSFNKIYRTSDIARINEEGDIKFCGRKDNQVKIRGFRIEIDEVENILNKCVGVKEATVIIKEINNNKSLVAFVCCFDNCNELSLREQLKKELPYYMIPTHFEFVDELPHSVSGKVNKKLIETYDISYNDKYVDDSLYTNTQKKLRKIWCKALGYNNVNLDSDFYEIGGHSLTAVQIKMGIEKEFGLSIDITEILATSKFIELSNIIESKINNFEEKIQTLKVNGETSYIPLTYAQKQLIFLYQLNNNSTEYNISGYVELNGKLDVDKFKMSYKQIVISNHSLRTLFFKENNRFYQKICDDISIYDLEVIENLNNVNIDLYIDEIREWKFDLFNGPLVKTRLINLENDKYIVVFAIHHIISDGWSVALMVDMWSKEYNRLIENQCYTQEEKLQFSDYAIWSSENIQGEKLDKLEKYWIEKLKGTENCCLEIITDYKRPLIHTNNGDVFRFKLDKELSESIKRVALNNQSTLFMVLFTAFNILLNKITRKNDFNIGVPVVGRNLKETNNILGMFINTIVKRTIIYDQDRFKDVLLRVKEETILDLKYQEMPFERIVESLNPKRNLSYTPLFQILFNMLNIEQPVFKLNGIKTVDIEQKSRDSKYDMTIYASNGDNISFEFLFNTDLFSKQHIVLLAEQFKMILSQISKNDKINVSDITISKNVRDVNNTQKIKEKIDISEVIIKSFEANSNNIAVADQNVSINYRELGIKVKNYAGFLQATVKNECVFIYSDRNINLIYILIACVLAKKTFAIIDSRYPINRIRNMINTVVDKVLVDVSSDKKLNGLLSTEEKEMLIPDEIVKDFEYVPIDGESYYIVFTSGTMGQPKAIKSRMSCVLHFIRWYVTEFDILNTDKFSLLSGLSHDPIMRDVFTPLLQGASLYVPSEDVLMVPGRINAWLNTNSISIIHQTPSILKMFSNDKVETLRMICFGGERLYDYHIDKVKEFADEAKIINFYGTSETPQVMTYYVVNGTEKGIIPIGKSIDDVNVFVVDKHLKPVGKMGIGEIVVQTEYLSEGYISGNEANKVFINLFGTKAYITGDLGYIDMNDNVVLLAREDEQLKNRGYRVEPSEIEREILKFSTIKDVKVLLCDGKLIAFLTENRTNTCNFNDIKQKLIDILPIYMIPDEYLIINEIPLTVNGKTDNNLLMGLFRSNTRNLETRIKTSGSTIEIVKSIWEKLLNVDNVGMEDNFFDLGGHSSMLIELNERLHESIKEDFEIIDLFKYPTINSFCEYLNSKINNDAFNISKQTDTEMKKERLRKKRIRREAEIK